jgi:hypothetical protein
MRNVVKMNLSSLAFNNYNFTYERLIGRKTSVLAGYRYGPATALGGLKLTDKIATRVGDEDIRKEANNTTAANNAITAEIRFYGGRKPGAKGVYFGLYGRRASFDVAYRYEYATATKNYIIPLQAKAHGLGGGFLIGAQFALAKRVMVDLYLLGAHYGKLDGNLDADINLSGMTAQERRQLEREINDLGVIGDKTLLQAQVSSNGVIGKISGPFAGLRGLGLNIGFAF